MPLKKIALLTIAFLIPSFVYFIMCPCAHSFTSSKTQQLVVMQQFQKNNLQHKGHTSVPLWHPSLSSFNLCSFDETTSFSLRPSPDQQLSNNLIQLKTTRLNI